MNKEDFLKRLEDALTDVSEGEKAEALQYYRDYFEDAGPDKEEEVLASLGAPEEVARNIKEEGTFCEYTEKGFQDGTTQSANAVVVPDQMSSSQNGDQGNANTSSSSQTTKSSDSTTTAVVIIIAILTSPVWVPILFSIFGAILSCIGCFIGFAISGVVLAIAAIITLVLGITCLFSSPALGAIVIGIALILGVAAILFVLLTVVICKYFIPFLVDCVKKFWSWIFKKKKEGAVA